MLQRVNVWLTATGVLVFAALLWFVHGTPDRFDRAVGEVVVSEVGDRLHAALPDFLGQPAAPGSLVDDFAARLPGQLGQEVSARLSAVEVLSKPDAMEIAWRVLAAVCECERSSTTPPDLDEVLARVSSGLQIDLADARAELARTEEWIRAFALGEYHAALAELRRDVSIFAGTTLALFLGALLLGVFKGRASAHLLPISLVLTGTTLVAGAWYLLGQDWIMTVVLSDYWGLAYPVFAGILTAFLLDIAVFRARLTTLLLNGITGIPVVPC